MRVALFSAKPYDKQFFDEVGTGSNHEVDYFEVRLTEATAPLAVGYPCICVFVNDTLNASVIEKLAAGGLRLIALRCAGFNNVDLAAAEEHGVAVVRVPAYSPHAVAEHTVALMLSLNRCLSRAFNRVREANFSLQGLLGFDFHGRTVGVIGTGKIGEIVCQIMRGFGCDVVAFDVAANPQCEAMGVRYVELPELYRRSDVITVHCPLNPHTKHLIDANSIQQMKRGVMVVNTSRGGIINTKDVIEALKSGQIGSLGIDVYEEEADLFFEDLSDQVIQDDVFSRLLTFPNVLVTGHQAFFTSDALSQIASTTLDNIGQFEEGRVVNGVRAAEQIRPATVQ